LHITSQSVITRDNITLNIDGILSLKVVDAAAAGNNIMDYKLSVIQLAMTTMRNAVGSLELDECFQNRDTINSKILTVMTETTQS
jgi:regulator of protease activity HflC (stomatin/prohibitin superfamily)